MDRETNLVEQGDNNGVAVTEKLFVYGIFLDEDNRRHYGMSDPRYATVLDWATVGGQIVQAVYRPGNGFSLTGLLVDMDSSRWSPLDMLEGGYDRVKITTTDGEEAWMYAERIGGGSWI